MKEGPEVRKGGHNKKERQGREEGKKEGQSLVGHASRWQGIAFR